MRKKRISGKAQAQRKHHELRLPAERISELLLDLRQKGLVGIDAIRYGLLWLEHRFTAVRVTEISDGHMALSTESGYEMQLKFEADSQVLRMYLLKPGQFIVPNKRSSELYRLEGLKATMPFSDGSSSENTLDRVLYCWFLVLNDYHEAEYAQMAPSFSKSVQHGV